MTAPRLVCRTAFVAASCLCLAVLGGCASYRAAKTPRASAARIIDAPRAAHGNPPFYEVAGHRYYVLSSSTGYRERGIASWYGRDFDGQPTSGGETYDMNAMTAAHKTLPIPTWVEVTNLSNGKHVIVKVNDRGPFVANRIIDLSYRAARKLDMIRTGTAYVEVRALGTPAAGEPAERVVSAPSHSAAPARAAATVHAPSRSERSRRSSFSLIGEAVADTPGPGDRPMRQLYIQVGAFAKEKNALFLVDKLKRNGFENSFVYSAVKGHKVLHRVRIGPLSDVKQFDRVSAGLRSIGIRDSRLVVEN